MVNRHFANQGWKHCIPHTYSLGPSFCSFWLWKFALSALVTSTVLLLTTYFTYFDLLNSFDFFWKGVNINQTGEPKYIRCVFCGPKRKQLGRNRRSQKQSDLSLIHFDCFCSPPWIKEREMALWIKWQALCLIYADVTDDCLYKRAMFNIVQVLWQIFGNILEHFRSLFQVRPGLSEETIAV